MDERTITLFKEGDNDWAAKTWIDRLTDIDVEVFKHKNGFKVWINIYDRGVNILNHSYDGSKVHAMKDKACLASSHIEYAQSKMAVLYKPNALIIFAEIGTVKFNISYQ